MKGFQRLDSSEFWGSTRFLVRVAMPTYRVIDKVSHFFPMAPLFPIHVWCQFTTIESDEEKLVYIRLFDSTRSDFDV